MSSQNWIVAAPAGGPELGPESVPKPGATLVILNPHAGGGRAGRLWSQIEPLLWQKLGDLVVAITQHPDEVAPHLRAARDEGLTRVIAVGGDGTNHFIVNELARLNRGAASAPTIAFGSLPLGTGHDWIRTLGTPHTVDEAVNWIAGARAVPIDVGTIRFDSGAEQHFLNIASVGVSGEVVRRTDQPNRRPWTYLAGTLNTLLSYRPQVLRVRLDGALWYEGPSYLVAVANGRFFGHNMMIAPEASISDGLFDVVLIEGMPRLEAITALRTTYTGAHVKRSDVHIGRARVVEIDGDGPLLGEKDGEGASGTHVRFELIPGCLHALTA